MTWLEKLQRMGVPYGRVALRFLALHSGVPALVVAALLVVCGWRILKKGARLAVEVAVVAGALLVLTELGVIRW